MQRTTSGRIFVQRSSKPGHGVFESRGLTPVSTPRKTSRQCTKTPFIPDSTLSVLSNDLDYIENALGVDLHTPLESVAEAHEQVRPLIGEFRD